MSRDIYTDLQLRELFHLEFLRWFGRKVRPGHYAVKGGVNIRLFFKSPRYSEDIDIDLRGLSGEALKKQVMGILQAPSFRRNFAPFGIKDILPPDLAAAKQTATTQRFKVHLITVSGLDLFTKIEFSRRGFSGKTIVEAIPAEVLRGYRISPLFVSHYDAASAVLQKIGALASRSAVQARDIFDLFILSGQTNIKALAAVSPLGGSVLSAAHERVFEVDFPVFRDTVVSYLAAEDQEVYEAAASWEEVRLKVSHLIEEFQKPHE